MLSIITASYNYEKFIGETIESVLTQTSEDWELIIADDGSKDNSIEIINKYCERDDRIKLYTHDNNVNKGLAETLKLGISKCSGEYIAFLESDDKWTKDNVKNKIEAINKNPDASIIINDLELIGDKEYVKEYYERQKDFFNRQKQIFLNENFDFTEFLRNNYFPTFSCVTIKKEYLEKADFNSPSKPNLDWYLYVQILSQNPNIVYIPSKDTLWRVHSGSYISERKKVDYNVFFDKLHEIIQKKNLPAAKYNFSKILRNRQIEKIFRRKIEKFDKKLAKKYPNKINVSIINKEVLYKKSKILSICIPTYNRAKTLEKTLQNLTSQEFFQQTDCVEIVISDNCSTDQTQTICQKYKNLYGEKIIYNRNSENIRDKNFEKALSLGNGEYLKLCNDTLQYRQNSLEEMCKDIYTFINKKPILCFSSGFSSSDLKYIFCKDMNEFISNISYGITAIGTFGIWKSDFEKIKDFNRYSDKQLVQVDAYLRQLYERQNSVIITPTYFKNIIYTKKGGYNIAEVFGKNYLTILSEYLKNKTLSKKVFEKEKKKLLLKHINKFYFDFERIYSFKKDGYFRFLKEFYTLNYYFYTALIKISPKIIKQYLHNRRIEKKLKNGDINFLWRDLNKHNETTVSNHVNIEKLVVGNYTYGNINMYHSGSGEEKLFIGNFCSIAPEVTFLLASEHNFNGISTFPFKVKILDYENEAGSKGSIIVGDDVWIGYGAIIMSGVSIGQGAIIGAGSIITKDVPPYAIVAGNPAKIIKYRFSEDVIEKLLNIDFSSFSKNKIKELSEFLYTEITIENIDEIIQKFS